MFHTNWSRLPIDINIEILFSLAGFVGKWEMAPITAAAAMEGGKKEDLVAILDAGAQFGKVILLLWFQVVKK